MQETLYNCSNVFGDLSGLFNTSDCSKTLKDTIFSKMKVLMELLTKITEIKNSKDISPEVKSKRLGEIFSDFNFESFGESLSYEISETQKVLQEKIKDIAKKAEQIILETSKSLENVIKENIKLVLEAREAAKREDDELKHKSLDRNAGGSNVKYGSAIIAKDRLSKSVSFTKEEAKSKSEVLGSSKDEGASEKKSLEDEYDKDEASRETALTEYKAVGFFDIFKEMWEHRKDNPNKVKGLFSVLKDAYSEAKSSDVREYRKSEKDKADRLYEKQCEIAGKIKKYEVEAKKLGDQLKETKKELASYGKSSLQAIRDSYDQSIRPVTGMEISIEQLKNLGERLIKFGLNTSKEVYDIRNQSEFNKDEVIRRDNRSAELDR